MKEIEKLTNKQHTDYCEILNTFECKAMQERSWKMKNKQYAYVIKRDDDYYFTYDGFNNELKWAQTFAEEDIAEQIIDVQNYKCCKVQKICIMECEEDD